jgi:hypothetical protein
MRNVKSLLSAAKCYPAADPMLLTVPFGAMGGQAGSTSTPDPYAGPFGPYATASCGQPLTPPSVESGSEHRIKPHVRTTEEQVQSGK